ncbi:MAG: DUF86 domain-containing protein [Actinomycetota bacterium]
MSVVELFDSEKEAWTTIRGLGFLKAVEIVGEASRGVSESRRSEHVSIDWSGLIGLRNLIVHQCDRVDVSRLASTVRDHFPRLIVVLRLGLVVLALPPRP